MSCLFCGQEIGPLRLLRDDEFCCPAHRKQYAERLGTVLNRIGAPEQPPAGVAGFDLRLPYQDGNPQLILELEFGRNGRPVRTGVPLRMTLASTAEPDAEVLARDCHAAEPGAHCWSPPVTSAWVSPLPKAGLPSLPANFIAEAAPPEDDFLLDEPAALAPPPPDRCDRALRSAQGASWPVERLKSRATPSAPARHVEGSPASPFHTSSKPKNPHLPTLPPRTLPLAPAVPETLPAPLSAHPTPILAAVEIAPAVVAPALPLTPVQDTGDQRPQPIAAAQPEPVVPLQGFIPLEFYCERAAGTPVYVPAPVAMRADAFLPAFALTPVLEKLEPPAAQPQEVRKPPKLAEVFSVREAPVARRSGEAASVVKAIAAGVVIGAILYFGLGGLNPGQRSATTAWAPAIRQETPAELHQEDHAAANSTGSHVSWWRRTLASRATVELTDNFGSGLAAWQGQAKTYPAGWSRHADGYIHIGQLALYRPSMGFADYRLEFFGYIESKGMGWAVRAHDERNYQAMKVTVLESGLRPIIAIEHYPVVGGAAGHRVATPLNIMVHNNEPYHVAVEVKGNRFTTSIEGQEVDSFTDNTIASGGVGFFSEAGERARLYWTKVTKNDDFLGRICAYLSDDSSVRATTAGLTLPEWQPLDGAWLSPRRAFSVRALAVVSAAPPQSIAGRRRASISYDRRVERCRC